MPRWVSMSTIREREKKKKLQQNDKSRDHHRETHTTRNTGVSDPDVPTDSKPGDAGCFKHCTLKGGPYLLTHNTAKEKQRKIKGPLVHFEPSTTKQCHEGRRWTGTWNRLPFSFYNILVRQKQQKFLVQGYAISISVLRMKRVKTQFFSMSSRQRSTSSANIES